MIFSFNFKFSNDQNNGTFSNQVSFLIYDSLCQQCDSNNACTIKVKLYNLELIFNFIFQILLLFLAIHLLY